MTRRVLLVEIGSDNAALPAVTPPAVANASWVPAVYVPPPLPPPTGLVVLAIADAAQLNWVPAAVDDAETVIESAPDDSGAPGAWVTEGRTDSSNYLLALPSGPRWVRLKTVRFQHVSVPTAAVLATPVDVDQAIADAAAAKAAADLAKQQADFANDAIDVIRADGILDAGEKPNVMRLHQILGGQIGDIWASADEYGVSRTAHDAALDALNVFLGGLTPAWNDTTTDTPINRITFDDKWEAYYAAKQALLTAIAAKAKTLADAAQATGNSAQTAADAAAAAAANSQTDADAANAALNIISDDGMLTKGEKPSVVKEWNSVADETDSLRFSADKYGVSRVSFDAKLASLSAYLSGLSPPYNSYDTDTPINRTTFNAKWNDYYNYRTALLTSIANAAKDIADAAQATGDSAVDGLVGGRNLLFNAGFETDLNGYDLVSTAAGGYLQRDAAAPGYRITGTHNLSIRIPGSYVSGVYTDARLNPAFAASVVADEYYIGSVWCAAHRGSAVMYLQFRNTAGTDVGTYEVGSYEGSGGDSFAEHSRIYRKVQAPDTAATVVVFFRGLATASESSLYAWFTHPMVELVSAAQTKPSPWDAGVNGLEPISRSGGGLQNPGSNRRLGDGRNMPMVSVGNVGAQWSGMSVSYSTTTTSATLTASAATLHEGGVSIAYNQASVTVSGTAGSTVIYYLYYDDPTHAGGSRTLNATTASLTAASGNGRLRVAPVTVTYPTSGTGGGSYDPPPQYCVSVDAWTIRRTADGWEFARAGTVKPDHYLRVIDPVTGAERWGRVSRSFAALAECVRVETATGTALTCSMTAPLGTKVAQVLAPFATGRELAERRYGRFGHSACVESLPVGERMVQHITCENDYFLAGDSTRMMLAHHNIKTMEP